MEEIAFWIKMETIMLQIQKKRRSIEVSLALELLKEAEEIDATAISDVDTGELLSRLIVLY